MELLDFAKCGLLENVVVVVTSIRLPLWQTGIVTSTIVLAQIAGTLFAYQMRRLPLPLKAWKSLAVKTAAIVLAAATSSGLSQFQC